MFTRRTVVAGLAASGSLLQSQMSFAQSWRAQYPELVFAVIPSENSAGVVDRWTPFVDYLTKQLGVKVTLRIANDYAAVIEGQRSGNIHIGYYGPASFARARLTGVKTDAFAIEVNKDGSKGYYSVFYVMATSPYKTIQDVKGKSIGLVDPNSTSGYNMPLYALNKLGIDADSYFSNQVITGSHENAVLALAQGSVDVAANFWNAPHDSNLTRMLAKGMVKNRDGSSMKEDDFRIVLTSDLIINSPYAYLSNLPDDLKASIRKAFFDVQKNAPEVYAKATDDNPHVWEAVENPAYDQTIELIKFVDNLLKKRK